MFETAELGQRLSKSDWKRIVPSLRQELLEAQGALRKADFPVLLTIAGVDGAGKGQTVQLLNEWLDPRWIRTRSYHEATQDERERPQHWRYWNGLPAKGTMGIFLSAWYHRPLLDRVYGGSKHHLEEQLDEIVAFEQTLADDGAMILKFWMHLGRKQQEERLRALEADPLQAWRVTPKDWEHWNKYDDFIGAAERIITKTSTGQAPWHIVEGLDERHRGVRVGQLLRDALVGHLNERRRAKRALPSVMPAAEREFGPGDTPDPKNIPEPPLTVLSTLDMKTELEHSRYKTELKEQQARLNRLHRKALEAGKSLVLVFEGWDAGGKGGAIRRAVAAMDPRHVKIVRIAAPTAEERSMHYLWRFWRHVPRAGRVAIFDRSWYGRVLVERVEGFATEAEWRRAFAEINQFEHQLADWGAVVVKFWLHVTPDEQLSRFEERAATPFKAWKLTDEDWRNRLKWGAYAKAAHDMVERTSTRTAPWKLIPANDKKHARVQVVRSICEALENALESEATDV